MSLDIKLREMDLLRGLFLTEPREGHRLHDRRAQRLARVGMPPRKSLHHSAKLLAHDIMEQDLSPDVFEAAAWTLMSRVLALVGWANSTTCD